MTYLAIYILNGNGENYTLFGLYPIEMGEFANAADKFRYIRSFIGVNPSTYMIYESNGEPMKVYPAFPVEQVDTEYGPFTLEHLHQELFGSSYNSYEWVDDLDL